MLFLTNSLVNGRVVVVSENEDYRDEREGNEYVLPFTAGVVVVELNRVVNHVDVAVGRVVPIQ